MNKILTMSCLTALFSLNALASDIQVSGKYPTSLSGEKVSILADAYYTTTGCNPNDPHVTRNQVSYKRVKVEIQTSLVSEEYEIKVAKNVSEDRCSYTLKQIHLALVKSALVFDDPNVSYNRALNYATNGIYINMDRRDIHSKGLAEIQAKSQATCKLEKPLIADAKEIRCAYGADSKDLRRFYKIAEGQSSIEFDMISDYEYKVIMDAQSKAYEAKP